MGENGNRVYLTDKMVLFGIGIGAAYWIIECLLYVFLSYQTKIFRDNEDLEYLIKNEIKKHLKIPFLSIQVTGSSKTGFSFFKKTKFTDGKSDLDISIINELPVGRKPIQTTHRYDSHRLQVFGFIQNELSKGRQIYIVYPLIEESEKMDFKDLMDGYESISRAFPEVPLGILHGKMKPADKD